MCFKTKYFCVVLLSVCVEINSRHINIGQEKLDQPNSNLKTAVENGIESAEKAKSDASSDQTSSLAIYQTEAGNGRNLTDLDANTGSIHFSSQTDKNGGEPLPQKKTSAITNNEKSNVPKTDSTLGDENSLTFDALAVEQPMALKIVSERSTESTQQSQEPQLTTTLTSSSTTTTAAITTTTAAITTTTPTTTTIAAATTTTPTTTSTTTTTEAATTTITPTTTNTTAATTTTPTTKSVQPVPDELCSLLERQGFPLVSGCNKSGRLGIWN
ncbi:uncharacterized protein LOC128235002 [Mya arenaria]|uniref:uncharacterized protein LOC128235002 n=1 Tax=Mya arenaria TaxID=6604 RepID=UPI0022E97960|nr:uncharacterized protein LOC128235002 [Mya arenaria]